MLTIETIPVTLFEQNARILHDQTTNDCVIVDPGGDIPLILSKIPLNSQLKAIWITHSHIDHVSGVSALIERYPGLSVIAHLDDAFNRENLAVQSQMMQFPYSGDFQITQFCADGDLLNVGDFEFKVLSTPGHAIGHISFYLDSTNNEFNHPILIAGDALFQGSIGRTDLPGGNYQELINSIRTKLLTLPDNTVVCPGHGQNTTIKYERDTNPFLTN